MNGNTLDPFAMGVCLKGNTLDPFAMGGMSGYVNSIIYQVKGNTLDQLAMGVCLGTLTA